MATTIEEVIVKEVLSKAVKGLDTTALAAKYEKQLKEKIEKEIIKEIKLLDLGEEINSVLYDNDFIYNHVYDVIKNIFAKKVVKKTKTKKK